MFKYFAKYTTQDDALAIFQYPTLQLIVECIGYNTKTAIDALEIINVLIPKVLSSDFNKNLINLLEESNMMNLFEDLTRDINDESKLNTIYLFRDYILTINNN